jgi:sodium transport system permease protein
MKAAWSVFLKELVDALRDRRTLLTVLLSSVAMGPLVLVLISSLVSSLEERAEAREVLQVGIEHAPSLQNYLLRQGFKITSAPADYEQKLRNNQLGDPVLVVPRGFEADLLHGDMPLVELVNASGNQRSESGANRLMQTLQGFGREQAALRMASRGVSPALAQPVQWASRDLSNPAARAARITGMLPFFVLMAVLYGALNAALDTTAGERERGSLEPLLMMPASRWALVAGKWGAVAAVAMLIAVLSSLSFLPGQWLLRNENLAALFQYGPAEAATFLALLLPLAGALSAVLMAVAMGCKTFKEAQAKATVVLLGFSLLPMVSLFSLDGERGWHLWVPSLAQSTLMNRVLRGEAMAWPDVALPALICGFLTVLALASVVRQLRTLVAH